MKSLVVYDSTYGNTKKIAQAIAQSLDTKAIAVNDFDKDSLKNLNLLVVGSPIIGWMPSPNMQNFLNTFDTNDLIGLKVAAFDTRVKLFIHGDAVKKIEKALKLAGSKECISTEVFYVKGKEGPLLTGETERAKTWANSLKNS